MNYNKSILNDLYVAGLLHDTGKYLQKCSTNNVKHNILSQLFVLSNPKICVNADYSRVANMVAHHHDDVSTLTSEVIFGPDAYADMSIVKAASDNYAISDNDTYINILRHADSCAASSDRASEIESGKKGGRAPFAPLLSVVGKVFNQRIAVKHGLDYRTYVYDGDDETAATIDKNDPEFKAHIANSFKIFMQDIQSVKTIDELSDVLQKHWSTVNANTWKPEGEKLGNTTTSLFDHSKMTAAIAACSYINDCYGFDGIDMWHVVCNGISDDVLSLVYPKFDEWGICSPNIIYCTDTDGFFMLPSAFREEFKAFLKGLNKEQYLAFGETIDFDLAPDWGFKGCRADISTRFSEHYQGILDVFNENVSESEDMEYVHKHYKGKIIVGVAVNNFDKIESAVLETNDSISKLSTLFRVFMAFSKDVKTYLQASDCEIIKQDISEIIYACNSQKVYEAQKQIAFMYDRYVCNTTGLTFVHRLYNRYEDTISCVKNLLQVRLDTMNSLEDGIFTTILIHGIRYKLSALDRYNRVYKIAINCTNATLYKILAMYDEAMLYKQDKKAEHLVVLSRFDYLLRNIKDDTERSLLQDCKKVLYDKEKDNISSVANIYYEAIYDTARRSKK